MKRSTRMQPVIRVSEEREKQAAKELGDWQQALDQRRQQLTELQNYREEYRRYFAEVGSSGVSARRLIELQRFLAKLDQAVNQQMEVVASTERGLDVKRQSWMQARSKTQVLENVVSRYRDEEEVEQSRRDQKELDEMVQRRGGKSHGE